MPPAGIRCRDNSTTYHGVKILPRDESGASRRDALRRSLGPTPLRVQKAREPDMRAGEICKLVLQAIVRQIAKGEEVDVTRRAVAQSVTTN
jgi:hypothetical protein